MIDSHTADILGFIGSIAILGAYAYQTLRNAAPTLGLNALNFIGASLLALSLAVNYNLPALALESIWAAIALCRIGTQIGDAPMIIAVDGPAASGKGTIARALARHYGLPHLDTGLLYRAVAANVARLELDGSIEADAVAACDFDDSLLADPILRSDAIGTLASVVSAHPLVRASLLQRQKRFANQGGGAVLDGRDIGTVIAPDADAKLFVRATPNIRAKRRHAELRGHGSTISIDKVLADIRARDLRDSTRSTAPLVPAHDAALLDTSFLSIEASVQRAVELVERQVSLKAERDSYKAKQTAAPEA